MEIFEKNGLWIWRKRPGIQESFSTKEKAYEAAGMEMPTNLPLPEVREYDSLEEALADQDKDDLDLYEEGLIAEED